MYSTKKETAPRRHFLCLHTVTQQSCNSYNSINTQNHIWFRQEGFSCSYFLSGYLAAYYHLVGRNHPSSIGHLKQEHVKSGGKKTARYNDLKLTLSRIISSYLYMPSLPFTCNDKNKSFCECTASAKRSIEKYENSSVRQAYTWLSTEHRKMDKIHSTYSADFSTEHKLHRDFDLQQNGQKKHFFLCQDGYTLCAQQKDEHLPKTGRARA